MDIGIRKAGYNDVKEIMKIINVTVDNLENKNLFVADSEEFINDHIEKKGFSLLATCDKETVGYIVVRFPGADNDNLGKDLNFDVDLNRVAHMESTAVLPKYRNNGIQKILLKNAENVLNDTNYKYFMGTVDPENEFSLRSVKSSGYEIVKVTEKYGGLNRAIFFKEN